MKGKDQKRMDTLTMARKKKQLNPNEQLARAIIEQYQPKNVEDMQNAWKDIFGPMFEAMLQGEMNSHLGYQNNERGEKKSSNRRRSKRPGRRGKGDLSECNGTKIHRSSDTEFHQICTE